MFKRITVITVFLLYSIIYAQAEVENFTNLEFQISTRPEAKLLLNTGFIFPFLQGSGPLTSDNNITTIFTAEATPVSVNGIGEVIWTPVAFFLLSGGGMAGSGWNMALGDGIGLNKPENENDPPPRKAKIDGNAFDGLLWSAWGAGTLQFDLAALFPGDWNHVFFQTRQKFRYSAYTRAEGREPWIFENDDAENQNGWRYNAMYVLGYNMPLSPVLDMIALAAELDKPLYNTPGGKFWGEDLGEWIFSGMFNFSIHKRLNMTMAVQMRTRRNYGFSNFEHKSNYFYQDLEIHGGEGERHFLFYRAALILNYKIR